MRVNFDAVWLILRSNKTLFLVPKIIFLQKFNDWFIEIINWLNDWRKLVFEDSFMIKIWMNMPNKLWKRLEILFYYLLFTCSKARRRMLQFIKIRKIILRKKSIGIRSRSQMTSNIKGQWRIQGVIWKFASIR